MLALYWSRSKVVVPVIAPPLPVWRVPGRTYGVRDAPGIACINQVRERLARGWF
jgi:hypothetical protein